MPATLSFDSNPLAMDDCETLLIIGRTERLPLRDAVTMNGALIHGLDYDDTHMNSVIHATAATLPAVLSASPRRPLHLPHQYGSNGAPLR